jgi:tRNA threonylcarbamoyladenosine modification (KEOPS) complex  Pcc1 subunit
MLVKHKKHVNNENVIAENIKNEIKIQLNKIGILISDINMEMNTKNISLSIYIRSLPPLMPRR